MTKIAEGRMIIRRINLKIPPMKGEAIVNQTQPQAPECEPTSRSQPADALDKLKRSA